jgi:hypothetical protein
MTGWLGPLAVYAWGACACRVWLPSSVHDGWLGRLALHACL